MRRDLRFKLKKEAHVKFYFYFHMLIFWSLCFADKLNLCMGYYSAQLFGSRRNVSLKCHYDQIRDIHFFIFSDTIGLS